MKRIGIIGWEEGSSGQVSSWITDSQKIKIECYIHPYWDFPNLKKEEVLNRPAKKFSYPVNNSYLGKPLLFGTNWLDQMMDLKLDDIVLSNSSNSEREAISTSILQHFPLDTYAHSSAQIMKEANIGKGCIFEPLSYVGYRSEFGNFVHLKTGAIVDHHTVIQDFVNIFPGAKIAGNVLVGKNSNIYMGSTIINRVELGENTIVGAGSLVLQNFKEPGLTLVGIPAKIVTSS